MARVCHHARVRRPRLVRRRPLRPRFSGWSGLGAPSSGLRLSFASIDPVIEFTEWATQILRRTHEAARRFNPSATVRLSRSGSGVQFSLADEPGDGDRLVRGDGFEILVQEGLDGTVDVVEPHDQLILRPPGSSERSVRPR